jgi:cytochrome c peroxidase
VAQVDSFAACSRLLQAAAASGSGDEKQLQGLFLRTRLAYKNFEWAAEYFVPATSRFVNGPPVQEVEMAGHQVFEPAGLQVIEGYLFPKYDTTRKKELIRQLDLLQSDCDKYRSHFANIDIFDWQVFDAAKLEVFRIITLGIAGFDDPLTLRSMMESAAALQSLQKVLAYYTVGENAGSADKESAGSPDKENAGSPDRGNAGNLSGKFEAATGYLDKNDDFNSFNRAKFITDYCNPITIGISDLSEKLKIHVIRYNRLLNQDAKTLFDTNAFNVNAYAPDPSAFVTDEKIALGKVLFSDPILSGTGTRSCQSCHQPEKAFTDGLVKNTIIGNNQLLKRNTPTLLNSALQPSLFYDLRVNRLEEQSLSVVQSSEEMHGSLKLSVNRLWQDTAYRRLFSKAFPKKDRAGIDTLEVMNAIGSYVRSLVSLNSRFDEYMRGNTSAMNEGEINGFNLFMGKAKCGTCHYMPLFNGTFPPRYIKTEAEVIGVPRSSGVTGSSDVVGASGKNEIDGDMGRFDVIKIPAFRHAFKTPTLRNAARTAPYMHNGVFTTLEQVMDFYNKGGGTGLGLKSDNQTLPFDKLDLTEKERNEVIAFIRCLDSR